MVLSKEISMEVERIEVVKDWLKPKLVRNLQVFLGFANFYWQFIQSFNKIATPLISMLKMSGLPDKLASKSNDGSRSAFSKNNNSKLVSGQNNGDNEYNGFSVSRNGVKYAKKLGKLSKSGKSKSEKISKSQNLAKSEKKLSKSKN